jgi:hypothetical protein
LGWVEGAAVAVCASGIQVGEGRVLVFGGHVSDIAVRVYVCVVVGGGRCLPVARPPSTPMWLDAQPQPGAPPTPLWRTAATTRTATSVRTEQPPWRRGLGQGSSWGPRPPCPALPGSGSHCPRVGALGAARGRRHPVGPAPFRSATSPWWTWSCRGGMWRVQCCCSVDCPCPPLPPRYRRSPPPLLPVLLLLLLLLAERGRMLEARPAVLGATRQAAWRWRQHAPLSVVGRAAQHPAPVP